MLPFQGTWVRSLVGELKFYMTCASPTHQKKKKKSGQMTEQLLGENHRMTQNKLNRELTLSTAAVPNIISWTGNKSAGFVEPLWILEATDPILGFTAPATDTVTHKASSRGVGGSQSKTQRHLVEPLLPRTQLDVWGEDAMQSMEPWEENSRVPLLTLEISLLLLKQFLAY